MTRAVTPRQPTTYLMTLRAQFTWLRSAAALCASLGAIAICFQRGHVHIVLSDPGTYTSPLHHRCGLLMIGCVGWAIVELLCGVRRLQAPAGLRTSHSAT